MNEQNVNIQREKPAPQPVVTAVKEAIVKPLESHVQVSKPAQVPVPVPVSSPKPPKLKPATNLSQLKPKKSSKFKAILQYFDESLEDPYFYLTQGNNLSVLIKLDEKLQEPTKEIDENLEKKFTYITDLSSLKAGDILEALYAVDSKWYRVCVRQIDPTRNKISLYFLDYGNTESIDADSQSEFRLNKTLRKRNFCDDSNEIQLFSLEYQAIRVFYVENVERKSILDFINKIASVSDSDNEFMVKVVSVNENDYEEDKFNLTACTCGINFCKPNEDDDEIAELINQTDKISLIDTAVDQEVNAILEEKRDESFFLTEEITSLNLEKNSELDVSISHIVNTNEFYVQANDGISNLIDHQQKIQQLADYFIETKLANAAAIKPNDYVFVKYNIDSTWYRAVIVSSSHSANNTTLHEVYFVDYGNKEVDVNSEDIISIERVINEMTKINFDTNIIEILEVVIQLPFQAVRCKLDSKKENTRNTEILKDLVSDCYSFRIKIKEIFKENLIPDEFKIEIPNHVVSLSSEGKLLDNDFESLVNAQEKIDQVTSDQIKTSVIMESEIQTTINKETTVITTLNASTPLIATIDTITSIITTCSKSNEAIPQTTKPIPKLKIDQVYEAKLAFFGSEDEIFVNLTSDAESLDLLQAELNTEGSVNKNDAETFKINDFVAAKFYEDEAREYFSWYRAKILSIDYHSSKYQVLYIDFGNADKNLTINDIAKLSERFSVNQQDEKANRICLNGAKLDLEVHADVLQEFIADSFNLKITSSKLTELGFLYDVELWSLDMSKCLNSILNVNYEPVQIKKQEETPVIREVETPKLIDINHLTNLFTGSQIVTKKNSIFMDDLLKPYYFCFGDQINERGELKNEMDIFYEKKQLESLSSLKKGDYCAVFSDGSWYRAEVKDITSNEGLFLFYIDFGYEETVTDMQRVRKLESKFQEPMRFVFGACLADPVNINNDAFQFVEGDETFLEETLGEFFQDGLEDIDELKIVKKLDPISSDKFLPGESYYSVLLIDKTGKCLNELIRKKLDNKKPAKKLCPPLIKLTMSQLPSQKMTFNEKDRFMLFTRRVDLFYAFEESRVMAIQEEVQTVCHLILEEKKQFDIDGELVPVKGDLVFAKYEDDQSWYRCVVTNCNQAKNMYELFFIDFGNTEIAPKEDLLYAWDEKHLTIFKQFEPQAFKCRLFATSPPNGLKDFNEAQYSAFKKYTSDKIFAMKLIIFNCETSQYEVDLTEVESNSSIYEFLLSNKIGKRN